KPLKQHKKPLKKPLWPKPKRLQRPQPKLNQPEQPKQRKKRAARTSKGPSGQSHCWINSTTKISATFTDAALGSHRPAAGMLAAAAGAYRPPLGCRRRTVAEQRRSPGSADQRPLRCAAMRLSTGVRLG